MENGFRVSKDGSFGRGVYLGEKEAGATPYPQDYKGPKSTLKIEPTRPLNLRTLTDEERIDISDYAPGKTQQAIIDRLLENGKYDGFRIIYPDGTPEVVVYDPKLLKVSSPSIPKELEPLAAEARKYKSAEEFVKAKAGNQGVYHKEYDVFTHENRVSAKPFDYELMERALGTVPETKGNLVKVYRLTTNNRILPGDNVSIYNVSEFINADGSANIVGSKMGINALGGRKDVKLVEQWIPKDALYQTSAGTQLYAPDGIKSLTDFYNKVKGGTPKK